MKMKLSLTFAAVLAALLTSSLASAQGTAPSPAPTRDYTEKKVDGGTVVTFPGDQLPGDRNDPYGGMILRPPRVIRAGLLQPRLNFIPELLKSVENI